MSVSHIVAFVIGMLGSIPGAYFGMAWYITRSLRDATPRQRELLGEVRRGIDEVRRELVDVPPHAAAKAHALDLRLSVLRAGEEARFMSPRGASLLCNEMQMAFFLAQTCGALHATLDPIGLAIFNAHTLELTFLLSRGGEPS
jgi:hypothetical protein